MSPEPLRVALVGCGRAKLARPAPARQLYIGGLFVARLAHAEQPGRYGAIYIVSAKHALVQLDEVLQPYDRTIRDLSPEDRLLWARRVWTSLRMLRPEQNLEVDLLAGADYAKPLLHESICGVPQPTPSRLRVELPLQGMTQGRQLQWLKQQRAASKEASNG